MKNEHLIIPGELQALNSVKFHHDAPLDRYRLLQRDGFEGDGGIRIVTHMINDLPSKVLPYSDLHRHDCDEINVILSNDNSLVYRIRLEDEEYMVKSPTTVYIPKGMAHAAEAVSGRGVYVVIIFAKEYKAYQ